MDRLKYVDGLRGIFALVVALYHLHGRVFFPGGYLAVDFFFILSGFILSHVYLQRMQGLTFLGFAGQRFSRLWPLHMVTLLLYTAVFMVSHSLAGHDLSDPELWGTKTPLTFVKNVFMVHDIGFNIPLSWNFPSWSVSTEFYVNLVLFFAFVGLTVKSRSKWILRTVFVLVLAYFVIDIYKLLVGTEQSRNSEAATRGVFYSNVSRGFVQIFLGVLMYFGVEKIKSKASDMPAKANLFTSCLQLFLFAGVVYAVCLPGAKSDTIGVILFSILLVSLSTTAKTIVKNFLSSGPLVYLGTISYAIYLTHMPVFEFFRQWPDIFGTVTTPVGDSVIALGASIIILFVLSTLLHMYVEKPAQRWLRNLFSGKRKALGKP